MAIHNVLPVLAHGQGGKLLDVSGPLKQGVNSIAVLPNGKLAVLTNANLVRQHADGTVDTSFGDGGQAATGMAFTNAVLATADGKFLVGGFGLEPGRQHKDFQLARFNADGSRDTTFANGLAQADINGAEDLSCGLLLQADGKAVQFGNAADGPNALTSSGTLLRYLADGKRDPGFGKAGQVQLPDFDLHHAALQADGKLLLTGNVPQTASGGRPALVVLRLNADGSIDTGFGRQGYAWLQDGTQPYGEGYYGIGESLAVQADGRILVAGTMSQWPGMGAHSGAIGVARFDADGSLDASFGSGGIALTQVHTFERSPAASVNEVTALLVQSDGRILVGGMDRLSSKDQHLVVHRLRADGQADDAFGQGGTASVSFPTQPSGELRTMALLADGGIVVGGAAYTMGSFTPFNGAMAQFRADGTLDARFMPASGSNNAIDYVQGFPGAHLDGEISVRDDDIDTGGNYAGASVTLLRQGGANASDLFVGVGSLALRDGRALLDSVDIGSVSTRAGSLSIAFNANATQARVDRALQSLAYRTWTRTGPTPACRCSGHSRIAPAA